MKRLLFTRAQDQPALAGLTKSALLVALLGIYLGPRLPVLLGLPLFNDEAIYILRSQRFPALLSATLQDGKLLQELALAALLQLPGDPLLLSRLFSILCGLGTLLGLALLGRAVDQPTAGMLAALFYALAPGVVLHDRLGLPDSLLVAISCAILLASLHFARLPQPGRREALGLGALLGMASLTKLAGLFLFWTPLVAVLLAPRGGERRRRLALLRLTLIAALACIALLAPLHYGGAEGHKIGLPGTGGRSLQILGHVQQAASWVAAYLPAPLLLLVLAALAIHRGSAWPARNLVVVLLGSSMALILTFIVVGSRIAPRYLLPAWPGLLLASALAALALWQTSGPLRLAARSLCCAALLAALAWDTFFAIRLLADPLSAPLVAIDRRQYLETWTAGHHMPEIVELLRQRAAMERAITVVGHDQQRLIHLAPQIYLYQHPAVRFETLTLDDPRAPQQLQALARTRPTYVLFDEQEHQAFDVPNRFPGLQQEAIFVNPLQTMRFYVYRQ